MPDKRRRQPTCRHCLKSIPSPGLQEPVWRDFLTRLAGLKKDPVTDGVFDILTADSHIQARWHNQGQGLYGVFNVRGQQGPAPVDLPAGLYQNLLDDRTVRVREGQLVLPAGPVVLRYGDPGLPAA